MKVYILDRLHEAGVEFAVKHADEVVCWDDPAVTNWHIDADALIVRRARITEADLHAAKVLKVISKQGVGVENIDLASAERHRVAVCNSPGVNSETIAEMSVALGLAVSRRIVEFDRMIRAGELVERSDYLGVGCWQKVVGVVGMGNIGIEAARKWKGAFDAKILAYDPYTPNPAWANLEHERVASLVELLPRVDILTLHLPLTSETRNLIGAPELSLMKESAIVINVSRGGIVHEGALFEALDNGRLFGAGLDVFEVEPPSRSHPLLSRSDVVATPHAAGGTEDNQRRSAIAAAKGAIDVLRGSEPFHRVV